MLGLGEEIVLENIYMYQYLPYELKTLQSLLELAAKNSGQHQYIPKKAITIDTFCEMFLASNFHWGQFRTCYEGYPELIHGLMVQIAVTPTLTTKMLGNGYRTNITDLCNEELEKESALRRLALAMALYTREGGVPTPISCLNKVRIRTTGIGHSTPSTRHILNTDITIYMLCAGAFHQHII